MNSINAISYRSDGDILDTWAVYVPTHTYSTRNPNWQTKHDRTRHRKYICELKDKPLGGGIWLSALRICYVIIHFLSTKIFFSSFHQKKERILNVTIRLSEGRDVGSQWYASIAEMVCVCVSIVNTETKTRLKIVMLLA